MATKSKAVAKQEAPKAGAVVPADPSTWAMTRVSSDRVVEALANISRAEGFKPQDLPSVSVPGGGGQTWEVPAPGGATAVQSFKAVILHHHDVRTFWARPFGSGEKSPPDCASSDGVRGYGNPGGLCKGCMFNKRKDSPTEQVCSIGHNLYLLMPEMILPVLLKLPLMSLNNFRNFVKNDLALFGLRTYEIVTEIGLERRQNQGGIAYSAVTLKNAGAVPEDALAHISEHVQSLTGFLRAEDEANAAVAQEFAAAEGKQASAWGGPAVADDDDDDEDDDIPM